MKMVVGMLMDWTWSQIAGCVYVGIVVLGYLVTTSDLGGTLQVAFSLGILLAILLWSDIADQAYRKSFSGFSHSDGQPTPGILVRFVVWICMLVFVLVPLLCRPGN